MAAAARAVWPALDPVEAFVAERGWTGDAGDVAAALAALGFEGPAALALLLPIVDLAASPRILADGPVAALGAWARGGDVGEVGDDLLEPFFDKAVYERRRETRFGTLREAVADFLTVGREGRIVPTGLFHDSAYVARYPDVAGYPDWLFVHFLQHGWREGRSPGLVPDPAWFGFVHEDRSRPFAKSWIDPGGRLRPLSLAARTAAALGGLPGEPLEALAVIGAIEALADARGLGIGEASLLLELIDVRLLVAECAVSPLAAEGGGEPRAAVAAWAAGHHPDARASHLFDAEHYGRLAGRAFPTRLDALLHFVAHGPAARHSPTPLYDEAFYRWRYRDLRRLPDWAFWHFLRHGLSEGRQGSPLFDPAFHRLAAGSGARPPLLDYLTRDDAGEPVRPAPGWPILNRLAPGGAALTAVGAGLAERGVFDYAEGGTLRRLIEEIGALEPQIRLYDERRVHTLAPFNAPHLAELIEARRRVGRADILVLRDQITFGGVDIVGMHLVNALRLHYPEARIVVLSTLGAPYADSLAQYGAVEHVDLTDLFASAPHEVRVGLMYDVVIGASCRGLVVLNSYFGWEAVKRYGRQLTRSTLLYGFLFCDDRDPNGEVDGYPARYFLDCFPWLERLFVDSQSLYDTLGARMLGAPLFRHKTLILPTPGLGLPRELSVRWRARDRGVRPRIAWAGRFDRQKRVDLLLAIAAAFPEADFLVWGKAVLDEDSYDWSLPNVTLMGLFTDYGEIVDAGPDAFLYTSAWDGVPTILLAVGEIGIPMVASDVGGVAEAVPPQGLVDASAGAEAYVARLKAFLAPDDRFRAAWDKVILNRLAARSFKNFRDKLVSRLGALDDRFDDHRPRAR